MSRYKILVLIKSVGLGGAERLLVDALPYVDRNQFDYHFAYLLPWKDFLVPEFEAAGYPITCLGTMVQPEVSVSTQREVDFSSRGITSWGWLPIAMQQLRTLHRREKFDLIHAHLPLAGVLARSLGRLTGTPVIYTEHNLQERYNRVTRWLNKQTYGWNTLAFSVSNEVTASITRHGLDKKTKVVTVPNGLPVEAVQNEAVNLEALRAELSIPPDHLVIGTVAVFRTQKRLTDWVEVAAQVLSQRQDVTFLLVGDGPENETVWAKIQALGLEQHFRLPGFRADGRRLMGLMDVYLMTSEFEGLPIAMLEAMALSKPIVATRVGGIPEVITPGQEGFLTSVSTIAQLADNVLKLLTDATLRAQMGQRGVDKVKAEFHLKDRVALTEQHYSTLIPYH